MKQYINNQFTQDKKEEICGYRTQTQVKNSTKIVDLNFNICHYIIDKLTDLNYKDALLKTEQP